MKYQYIKKFGFIFPINAFVALTVGFFFPMETFLGNSNDFSFSFHHLWWFLPAVSLGMALIISLLEGLLPKKPLIWVGVAAFSLGFCYYIQAIALNGSMNSLAAERDVYSKKLMLINGAVWLLIIAIIVALAVIFIKKFGKKTVGQAVAAVSAVLIVMQATGLLSLVFSADNPKSSTDKYLSLQGETELSSNKNVVYFIIDTCDGYYVEKGLNQYPDLFDKLTGFTYFPNASTTYSRTYPSVPYLLTGGMCYFDKQPSEYVNEAFEKSDFINQLNKNQTDIRLFTDDIFVEKSSQKYVDNYLEYNADNFNVINIKNLVKYALKVSGYRGMPYVFKNRFYYTSTQVNTGILDTITDFAFSGDEVGFYGRLNENGIKASDKYDSTFRFYHFDGTHPGGTVTENVTHSDTPTTTEQQLKGNIKVIEKYIEEMKRLDVYKNSTIIITADHGNSGGGSTLDLTLPSSTIMLVKPAGTENEPLKTSLAPVCHEDLFATILDGLERDYTDFGKTIFEIEENKPRERKYYYTSLYNDLDGEIALREYLINGDARYLESYKSSGKYWDVNYSYNTVSNKRFSDK